MSATIIDGKAFAATVRAKVATHVARLKADHDITPGLAVVLVGEDPASQVYVRSKGKMTTEVGMNSYEHKMDVETSEADLLAVIEQLNNDPAVHGILVQLPLPKHLDEDLVINAIDPINRIQTCPLGLENHSGTLCPLHRKLDESIELLINQFSGISMADMIGELGDIRPLCDEDMTTQVELTMSSKK